MKQGNKFGIVIVVCALIALAVWAQPIQNLTSGIYLQNADNTIFFKGLNTASNQTANLMEFWNNPASGPTFFISASGVIPSANCGIQSGTNLMAGSSVTNTFTTAYASPPRVVACASDATTVCGVTNITSTNFVIKSSVNALVNWMAVAK